MDDSRKVCIVTGGGTARAVLDMRRQLVSLDAIISTDSSATGPERTPSPPTTTGDP